MLILPFILLLITIGWFKKAQPVEPARGRQFISIIIPFRNEEKNLAPLFETLQTICRREKNFEIIFVDDHSSDSSASLVQQWCARNPDFPVSLCKLETGAQGKKAAITFGIRNAAGEIILCTDADCELPPAWIETHRLAHRNINVRMAAGPVLPKASSRFTAKFQELEYMGILSAGAGMANAGFPFICSGANFSYRKEDFLEMKGFEGIDRVASGDDVLLLHKFLRKHKGKFRFIKAGSALVKTVPAGSWNELFVQQVRWGSKVSVLSDKVTVLMSVFMLYSWLETLAGIGLWMFLKDHPLICLAPLSIRLLFDFLLVFLPASEYRRYSSLIWFLPAFLVNLLFLPIVGLFALGKYEVSWKGRQVK